MRANPRKRVRRAIRVLNERDGKLFKGGWSFETDVERAKITGKIKQRHNILQRI